MQPLDFLAQTGKNNNIIDLNLLSEIILKLEKDPCAKELLSSVIQKMSAQDIKSLLHKNGSLLRLFPQYHDNEEMVLAAISKDVTPLEHMSARLKQDKHFAVAAKAVNPQAFKYFDVKHMFEFYQQAPAKKLPEADVDIKFSI